MTKDVIDLYKEYFIDRGFERLDLWQLLQENMKTKIDQLILRFILLTVFVIPVDSLEAGDELKRRSNHGAVENLPIYPWPHPQFP